MRIDGFPISDPTSPKVGKLPTRSIGSLATSQRCDRRSSAVVASRCSLTVVQRVRFARLISRGFCPIDKKTWVRITLVSRIGLRQRISRRDGVNEISVCATGEKQSGKRHHR